jgi:hypothetical protein
MAHSLLLIPVPELESVVLPRLERRSGAIFSPGADTSEEVAAHITLLGPFADLGDIDRGLVSELTAFFADVLPFHFELTELTRFPEGLFYLSPAPAAPFRQLTHELFRHFPEYPPYQGQFDEVIPHLSVPLGGGEDEETEIDQLRFELEPRLPVHGYAREARLVWWEPGASRTLEVFPFGTTAA